MRSRIQTVCIWTGALIVLLWVGMSCQENGTQEPGKFRDADYIASLLRSDRSSLSTDQKKMFDWLTAEQLTAKKCPDGSWWDQGVCQSENINSSNLQCEQLLEEILNLGCLPEGVAVDLMANQKRISSDCDLVVELSGKRFIMMRAIWGPVAGYILLVRITKEPIHIDGVWVMAVI